MITVVGTGTGAPPGADVAAGAELVVGGRRHLDAVRLPESAERVVLGALAPALDRIAEYVAEGRPVTVLASGDPGFFGIVRALAERFGPERLDVRPGVSSVAAAFARVGLPWDDAVVVSAHGRELRTAVNVCRAHPKTAVLTGPGAGPAELGAALRRDARILVVASALGSDEERVERVTPAEAAARDWGPAVSVVLCLDERRALGPARTIAGPAPGPAGEWMPGPAAAPTPEPVSEPMPRPDAGPTPEPVPEPMPGPDAGSMPAPDAGPVTGPVPEAVPGPMPGPLTGRAPGPTAGPPGPAPEPATGPSARPSARPNAGPAAFGGWALGEDAFVHRDSMITKFEVRALALARLGPRTGELIWDIGAGSGSVAVECARLGAAVVAVEKSADGAGRVRANAAAHGVDVRVVHGAAPTVLCELDDPDAVFVGGGGRELPDIVAACARRARRAVVVAMAALDRVPAARRALLDAGLECDGVLLQSSRLAPLPGDVTRLAATNPVFLLWGVRPHARTEGVAQ